MKERVQVYYDSDVNVKTHELIQEFEKEGAGKRGYTNARLVECLKVYKLLAERCGTAEPMDLLLFYIDSIGKQGQLPVVPNEKPRASVAEALPVKEEVKETQKVSDEVDDTVADFLADGDFTFEG